jgi:hypothetical protein
MISTRVRWIITLSYVSDVLMVGVLLYLGWRFTAGFALLACLLETPRLVLAWSPDDIDEEGDE